MSWVLQKIFDRIEVVRVWGKVTPASWCSMNGTALSQPRYLRGVQRSTESMHWEPSLDAGWLVEKKKNEPEKSLLGKTHHRPRKTSPCSLRFYFIFYKNSGMFQRQESEPWTCDDVMEENPRCEPFRDHREGGQVLKAWSICGRASMKISPSFINRIPAYSIANGLIRALWKIWLVCTISTKFCERRPAGFFSCKVASSYVVAIFCNCKELRYDEASRLQINLFLMRLW